MMSRRFVVCAWNAPPDIAAPLAPGALVQHNGHAPGNRL